MILAEFTELRTFFLQFAKSKPFALPTSWPPSLAVLHANSVALSGVLPSPLPAFVHTLGLANTRIGGMLPELPADSNLARFFARSCDFEGPIPISWLRSAKIREIELVNNSLWGAVPSDAFPHAESCSLDSQRGTGLSGCVSNRNCTGLLDIPCPTLKTVNGASSIVLKSATMSLALTQSSGDDFVSDNSAVSDENKAKQPADSDNSDGANELIIVVVCCIVGALVIFGAIGALVWRRRQRAASTTTSSAPQRESGENAIYGQSSFSSL